MLPICHVQQLRDLTQLDQLADLDENIIFILASSFSMSPASWIHALHSCTSGLPKHVAAAEEKGEEDRFFQQEPAAREDAMKSKAVPLKGNIAHVSNGA